MAELILFLSALCMVFFLGFQQLCVTSGNFWLAAGNSTVIGIFNLLLFKTAPNVSGAGEMIAYVVGGPIGICLAMYVHTLLKNRRAS